MDGRLLTMKYLSEMNLDELLAVSIKYLGHERETICLSVGPTRVCLSAIASDESEITSVCDLIG